jgi:hypothetical protein
LISDAPAVFDDDAGGPRLLAAVEAEVPRLAACSNWYERNTGAKRLAECPESPARAAASRALDGYLAQVELERLSFPSLNEAVNGLELLSGRRPDVRSLLAARLWALLPPSERWTLDPKKEMGLPALLLRLVAQAEYSDADAKLVVDGLVRCMTPQLIARCRTVDILWTLWALFTLACQRKWLTPSAYAQSLLPAFIRSLKKDLIARADQKGDRDELRARFALVGLLTLLGSPVVASAVTALGAQLTRQAQAGSWWLCVDQTFVTAYLVLRGIETAKPLPANLKAYFLRQLLSAAEEYPELDPAAEYLRQDVLRQKRELDQLVRQRPRR